MKIIGISLKLGRLLDLRIAVASGSGGEQVPFKSDLLPFGTRGYAMPMEEDTPAPSSFLTYDASGRGASITPPSGGYLKVFL